MRVLTLTETSDVRSSSDSALIDCTPPEICSTLVSDLLAGLKPGGSISGSFVNIMVTVTYLALHIRRTARLCVHP